jgi:hypothetical protein
MDKPAFAVDDPPAAFLRFKQALRQIVSVSKKELQRREEQWKKKRKAQRTSPGRSAR